jgi:Tol biopolymer transport system component
MQDFGQSSAHELTWIDRQGQERKINDLNGDLWGGISLSSDNHRLAFSGWGLWIHDIDSKITTRVFAESSPGLLEPIRNPEWSPGGNLLAYSSCLATFKCGLRLFRPDEGTNEEIFQPGSKFVESLDWFPDGKSLLAVITGESGLSRSEVVSISIDDRKIQSHFTSTAAITELRLSPDGRWLAFVSDEMGQPEVFVRQTTGKNAATKISRNGGKQPRWRSDGKALFYVGLNSSIMGVDIITNPEFASSIPEEIV